MADKTVQIKTSGGHYTSTQTAIDTEFALQPDRVAGNGKLRFEIYDGVVDGPLDTGSGWTTDATRYLEFVTVGSGRHAGKWTATTAHRIEMAGDSASVGGFTNRAAYTRLTGIQVKRATTGSFQNMYGVANYANGLFMDKCILWMKIDHGSGLGRGVNTTSYIHALRNCVLFANGSVGGYMYYGVTGNGTPQSIDNCTFSGFDIPISGYACDPCVIRNTIVQGAYTADYDLTSAVTTGTNFNLSNLSGAPGATAYNGKSVTFVDAANGDFHLHASDTEAKDKGTDLSGTFTDDIDGATRSGTWDLGADELTAAVPLTSGNASGASTGSATATVSVVVATGGTSPYTYQWYRSTSAAFTPSGANDVVGATSTTLNDTGLSPSTSYYYKCVVTDDAAATATSNEVSLATTAALASGTATNPTTGFTTATVVVGSATGGTIPYTYQWYRDTSPGFTPSGANDVVGATSATLNDTGLTASTTYYYQCITTDALAAAVTSNEVTVTTSAAGGGGAPRRVVIVL